jgi:hypothetical protein
LVAFAVLRQRSRGGLVDVGPVKLWNHLCRARSRRWSRDSDDRSLRSSLIKAPCCSGLPPARDQ